MRSKRTRGAEMDSSEESRENRPPVGDRGDETIAYAAGAAPAAPPAHGQVGDDREVDFGVPFDPAAPDDSELTTDSDQAEMAPTRRAAPAATTRSGPQPNVAAPMTPATLQTDDGRVVSVVHIVAELAPFAR